MSTQKKLMEQHAEQIRVAKELNKLASAENIKIIFVKGFALNHLVYGSELGHVGGDIDILVSDHMTKKMHAILLENGFRQRKGRTSIGFSNATLDRANMAIYGKSVVKNSEFPIKSHPTKPEFLPYMKDGYPTIEIHDSLYFWNETLIKEVFENGHMLDGNGCWILRPEYAFLLLLTNTYENSETFYSNSLAIGEMFLNYISPFDDKESFLDKLREAGDSYVYSVTNDNGEEVLQVGYGNGICLKEYAQSIAGSTSPTGLPYYDIVPWTPTKAYGHEGYTGSWKYEYAS